MTRAYFGNHQIDLAVREIEGPRGVRKLEPRAAQVLAELLRRPGEVVSRAELLDACWPDGGGSDEALSQSVAQLRRAFDDDSRRPRYVRTIHKTGYQWLAPASQEVVQVTETPVAPPTRSSRRWTPAAALILFLVVVAAYVIWGRDAPRQALSPADKAFVAAGGRIERVNSRVDEGAKAIETDTVTRRPPTGPNPQTRSPATVSPSG